MEIADHLSSSWNSPVIQFPRRTLEEGNSFFTAVQDQKQSVCRSVVSLCDLMEPTRLLCLWDSPGKNTGVGYYFLLQGIFPTQGSNWCLFRCKQIPYCLSHQGSLSPNQEVPQIKLNSEHSRTFQDEICFFFFTFSAVP